MEATQTELKIPLRGEVRARLWEIANSVSADPSDNLKALEQLVAFGGLHENEADRKDYNERAETLRQRAR